MKRVRIFFRKLSAFRVTSVLKTLIILCILGSLAWFLFHLNLFYIERIEVLPLIEKQFEFVDKAKIQNELLPYEGQRIFSIRTDSVRNSVLLADPFVDKVYVSKQMPSTMLVKIVEKQPAAVVRQGDINQIENVCTGTILDSDIVIDSKGKTITTCESNRTACVRLPLFVVKTVEISTEYIMTEKMASALYDLVSTLNRENIKVAGFGLVESNSVVVSFSDATRGVFSLQDIDRGIFDYLTTRDAYSIDGKSFREIDVRYQRPVVRVDKYSDWVFE